VHWCDGSDEEWAALTGELVAAGTLIPLDTKKRPNSFYARSDPKDVQLAHELAKRLLDVAMTQMKEGARQTRSEEALDREYQRFLENL
jgi:GTP-dependent phosphoenolpyruvate carboxykinase